MPVILRLRGYRLWFYEADLSERPHIHVGKDANEAKYWLDPVILSKSRGFREHELAEIQKIVEEHREVILGSWRREEAKRDHGKS
ncbi:MAG: DUF4160 domain-containing protein [Thermoguttaceae bacterium]